MLARLDNLAVALEDVLVGQAFPFAEGNLGQALIEPIACGRQRWCFATTVEFWILRRQAAARCACVPRASAETCAPP
jgi:hypothetical protein